MTSEAAADFAFEIRDRKFGTVLADPPWRFDNRTGKVAPEHRRLSRYGTLSFEEIANLPVNDCLLDAAHCYMWVPNALLPHGLDVLKAWGFEYKTNIVWHKIAKTAGRTVAVSVSISGMSRNLCCSEYAARAPGRSRRGGVRST